MIFWYTLTNTFDKDYGEGWLKYLEWSKLSHLKELISLDGMLNEELIHPNNDNEDNYYDYVIFENEFLTCFFTSLSFVLRKASSLTLERFNLLAVVKEPTEKCETISVENFEFVGYDLLDQSNDNSALSNCGGYDETFSPSDLNEFGLINKYENAYRIKKKLKENNPKEHHADTNVIAIWRHKTIGR